MDYITIGDRKFRWQYPKDCLFSVEDASIEQYKILSPLAKAPVATHLAVKKGELTFS